MPDYPILLGWDFGIRPACAVALRFPGGDLISVLEDRMDAIVAAAIRLECLKLACDHAPAYGSEILLGDASAVVTAAGQYASFVLGAAEQGDEVIS